VADLAPAELADFLAGELQRCRVAGAVGRASPPAGASGFQPRLVPPVALQVWPTSFLIVLTLRWAVRLPGPQNTFLLLHSAFFLLPSCTAPSGRAQRSHKVKFLTVRNLLTPTPRRTYDCVSANSLQCGQARPRPPQSRGLDKVGVVPNRPVAARSAPVVTVRRTRAQHPPPGSNFSQ